MTQSKTGQWPIRIVVYRRVHPITGKVLYRVAEVQNTTEVWPELVVETEQIEAWIRDGLNVVVRPSFQPK